MNYKKVAGVCKNCDVCVTLLDFYDYRVIFLSRHFLLTSLISKQSLTSVIFSKLYYNNSRGAVGRQRWFNFAINVCA